MATFIPKNPKDVPHAKLLEHTKNDSVFKMLMSNLTEEGQKRVEERLSSYLATLTSGVTADLASKQAEKKDG